MGEATGRVAFLNSHDYVSDLTGDPVAGCMAFLRSDDGSELAVHTGSLRLQQTLETAYATKVRVAVDFVDAEASLPEQQRLMSTAPDRGAPSSFLGPFSLKAIWTLE